MVPLVLSVNESEVEDGGRRLVVEKDFQALVDEFLDDREAIYSSFDGTKMASLMKIGSRVIRGPNWNWGNQVTSCLNSNVSHFESFFSNNLIDRLNHIIFKHLRSFYLLLNSTLSAQIFHLVLWCLLP